MTTITITETLEDSKVKIMNDIVCAALEGGINYWCSFAERKTPTPGAEYLSDVIGFGGVILLTEDRAEEGLTPVVHELNQKNLWCGMKKAALHFDLSFKDFYENHDAESADVAIQFAIFDKLIYG